MPGTDCARFVPRKGKISQGIRLITWSSDRVAFFALGHAFFSCKKWGRLIGGLVWPAVTVRKKGAQ